MISRWRFYASVAVLGCECLLCFIAGYLEWRGWEGMVGIDSAEAADLGWFYFSSLPLLTLFLLFALHKAQARRSSSLSAI